MQDEQFPVVSNMLDQILGKISLVDLNIVNQRKLSV